MTTTQTISREQLKSRIEKALKDFTEGRASMHVPPLDTDVDMVLSDCLGLLAAMGSEPVYQVNDGVGSHTWSDVTKDVFDLYSDQRKRIAYATPPAPVAVPDHLTYIQKPTLENILSDVEENSPMAHAARILAREVKFWRSVPLYAAPISPVAVPDKITYIEAQNIALAEGWDFTCDSYSESIAIHFWNACRAAMQAEPVTAANTLPGWIKCSERMPEAEVDVQVYCSDKKEQMVGYLERNESEGCFRFATWRSGDGIYCQPTHWMPLPAAPEQEV